MLFILNNQYFFFMDKDICSFWMKHFYKYIGSSLLHIRTRFSGTECQTNMNTLG